jgi:O-antigen ligase
MLLTDIRQTLHQAHEKSRLWWLAFVATFLIPWMLVFARAGIDICIVLVGIAFLAHSARTRNWQWVKSPLFCIGFLMWLWLVLIVSPLAVTPADSFPTSLVWIRYLLFFMALRYWVLTSDLSRRVLAGLTLLLLVGLAVDVLWQFITGTSLSGVPRPETGRLTGPFDNPKAGLVLGKLLLPALGLAMVSAALHARARAWLAPLAILMGIMITLVLTGDISVTISTTLCVGIVMLIMMVKQPQWRPAILGVLLLGMVSVLSLIATQNWVQLRIERGYLAMTNYTQSDYGTIARAAKETALAHPVHGVGIKNFRNVSGTVFFDNAYMGARHPHNFYLEWLVEAGVPGMLMFIVLVLLLWREAWRHVRHAKGIDALMPAIALAVVVQHFFPFLGMQSFFANWAGTLMWFPLAVAFACLPHTPPRQA